MNENGIVKSRRRFFSSFGAMAAAPVAGVAAAMGLRDEPKRPPRITQGAPASSAAMNEQLDALWRAVEAKR
jgi:hypothetical protein